MRSLTDLYAHLHGLHTSRRQIVEKVLASEAESRDVDTLKRGLEALEELPGAGYRRELEVGGKPAAVSLEYEMRELERDIAFLTQPQADFFRSLGDGDEAFPCRCAELVDFLEDKRIVTLITDRDGTINNYCAHYRSSYQSVYNACFLTPYCVENTRDTLILTSAPLSPRGILELNAMPDSTVHFAGSKGREYQSRSGGAGKMALSREMERRIERLNRKIDALLAEERYAPFALIGSGVQYKFGQTTVARQDIDGSIDPARSTQFLQRLKRLVADLDPEGKDFSLEDTGKDVEIMLNLPGGKMYTKGDGVEYLAGELKLELSAGLTLVCGDTSSDLPMIEAAAGESMIVPTPDVLVTALNLIVRKRL